MSRRRGFRFVVRFITLGIAAGTLAGYSAYAKRSTRAPDHALSAGEFAERQISNSAAKTNRLALLVPASLPAASADNEPAFALASLPSTDSREALPDNGLRGDLDRLSDMMTGSISPAPHAEPKQAAVAPAPLPHEKPKHLSPPVPPQANGLLDDSQIAGLKGRLRLTSDQAEYWPAVEEALRDVVRTQLRPGAKHHGGRANIDVNSPEVQKLIWAAMPLLMRLRDDQKSEVRKLARVIGLEQVASQI